MQTHRALSPVALFVLAGTASLTGCVGALQLGDFVDADRPDAAVPNGSLVTVPSSGPRFARADAAHLLADECAGFGLGGSAVVLVDGTAIRVHDAETGVEIAPAIRADDVACAFDRETYWAVRGDRLHRLTVEGVESWQLPFPVRTVASASVGVVVLAADARRLWVSADPATDPGLVVGVPASIQPIGLLGASPGGIGVETASEVASFDRTRWTWRAAGLLGVLMDKSRPVSPDAKLRIETSTAGVAVLADGGESVVWQVPSSPAVTNLAFFDDAPNLLVRLSDGTMQTWDPTDGESPLLDEFQDDHAESPVVTRRDARQAFYGPPPSVTESGRTTVSRLAISPDSWSLGAIQDTTVSVRDSEDGAAIASFLSGAPEQLAVGDGAAWVAVAERAGSSDWSLSIHALPDGASTSVPHPPIGAMDAVGDDAIVTGDTLGAVRVIGASDATVRHTLDLGDAVSALAVDSRRKVAAIGTRDGRVCLWAWPDRHRCAPALTSAAPVTALAFSAYGDLVAAGDRAGRTWLLSSHTGGVGDGDRSDAADAEAPARLEPTGVPPGEIGTRLGATAGGHLAERARARLRAARPVAQ